MKRISYGLLLAFTSLASSCGGDNRPQDPNPEPPTSTTEMKTVKYVSTNETFANPERGYYTEIESNATDAISESRIRKLRNEGKSLVQVLYYFKEYRDKDLPADIATKLNADMEVIRKVGMKAILRFAYTSAVTEADAPMTIIKRHMEQMKSAFTVNKDIIACTQAGFIGAWGEWYYSSNGLNNAASYKELLDKWLEVLPADRCIQVRIPKYKQDFLGSTSAIKETQGFSGQPIARIAHHNDAFMADETNMGTYTDVEKDKSYLATEGLYVPIGGETCLPTPTATPSTGDAAVAEMRRLRWSFLNDAYDRKVLNKWELDGKATEIKNKLGYRIVLTRGEYSVKHIPGSDLAVNISLQNIGYAPMYNPRDLKLVLRSSNTKTEYWAKLPDDPRMWKPLQIAHIRRKMALPADIPVGTYRLFLFMPDPEVSIASRPEYAVRLANKDIWESMTGCNDLGVDIIIADTGDLKQSTSAVKFQKKQ
ncbi:DUF4832 domain-containing protein [Bacteroides pyogenes]|uniref:DUF4832 domain-containing protein n=1 Tax=Bacteroides pyogenes TaxID=310300 RepID=UPI003B43A99D